MHEKAKCQFYSTFVYDDAHIMEVNKKTFFDANNFSFLKWHT